MRHIQSVMYSYFFKRIIKLGRLIVLMEDCYSLIARSYHQLCVFIRFFLDICVLVDVND